MTNAELADAFERGTAWVGSTEDEFEGATAQIIAALRRRESEPLDPKRGGWAKPLDPEWEKPRPQPSSDQVLVPKKALEMALYALGYVAEFAGDGGDHTEADGKAADRAAKAIRSALAAAEAEEKP